MIFTHMLYKIKPSAFDAILVTLWWPFKSAIYNLSVTSIIIQRSIFTSIQSSKGKKSNGSLKKFTRVYLPICRGFIISLMKSCCFWKLIDPTLPLQSTTNMISAFWPQPVNGDENCLLYLKLLNVKSGQTISNINVSFTKSLKLVLASLVSQKIKEKCNKVLRYNYLQFSLHFDYTNLKCSYLSKWLMVANFFVFNDHDPLH